MAVMYSKLGGCLGVTAKLGPLARTDLWAGVKGLLERLMTHWGLGSSFEEPWGGLLGVWGWVVFPGGGIELLGRTGLTCAWGSHLLPCLNDLVGLLPWPAWVELEGMRWRWAASFAMWKERSSLGGIASFPWGKGNCYLGRAVRTVSSRESSCLGGAASFPQEG